MANPAHDNEQTPYIDDDLLQPLDILAAQKAAEPEQAPVGGEAKPAEEGDFLSTRVSEAFDAVDFLTEAREKAEKEPAPDKSKAAKGKGDKAGADKDAINAPGITRSIVAAGSAKDEDSPAPIGMGDGLSRLSDATSVVENDPNAFRPEPGAVPSMFGADSPTSGRTPASNRSDDLLGDDLLSPTALNARPDALLGGDHGGGGQRIDPLSATAAAFGGEIRSLMDAHIDELLRMTSSIGGSDLHLTTGLPPMARKDGRVMPLPYEVATARDTQRLVYDVLHAEQIERFERTKELDFSYGVKGLGRYRFNVYRQRGSVGAAMRVIPHEIPSLEQLRLPPILRDLTRRHSGLILVTGPTGSGKSTTIASMIDVINTERECHIMTIEDPIEYLHQHKSSMINQRELGTDTDSFANALKAVLREDPDVILVGEMRDLETISAAITLAETGHLVFATLHTRSAPATVDRVVDVFPAHQQEQIRVQLSTSLEAVVSQQLLPRLGGGRVAAIEVMVATSALRNLIREGKTYQIYSVIETGHQYGMQAMDRVLADLHRNGSVSYEEAATRAIDRENFQRLLKGF